MTKSNYIEKLKDPRWQKKRLEILERDGWECKACGEKDNTLHVHHIFYLAKKEPWEIPNGFLITFCDDCHKNICPNMPCEECGDYNDGPFPCDGPLNHPKEIQKIISDLLNFIWAKSKGEEYIDSVYMVIKGIEKGVISWPHRR